MSNEGGNAIPSHKEKRKRDKKQQTIKGAEEESFKNSKMNKKRRKTEGKLKDDPYSHLDSATAAAMRQDDEEIAALEAKMGLSGSSNKEKNRLHKEYAKLECYGDDFGDFLDDIDVMVSRVVTGKEDEDYNEYRKSFGLARNIGSDDDNLNEDEDSDGDEIVPMKSDPFDEDDESHQNANSDDESSSHSSEERESDDEKLAKMDEKLESHGDDHEDVSEDESDSDDDGDDLAKNEDADHNISDTYRPSKGEDIYGNAVDKDAPKAAPKKYVPPHLRKQREAQQTGDGGVDEKDEKASLEEEEKRKLIRRSLNNQLNRLSEDTLISVAQAIAQLYQSNPTPIVNECIWKNLHVACIERPHLMTGLIPVYVACLAGVHIQQGDSSQLGEYLLEMTVTDLWKEIKLSSDGYHEGGEAIVRKEASNLMLVVCYLYNYGIVHCSLLYSVVRSFIQSFREVEVELLLLILSHCGRALRSDDPLALKEIVILVQKRALELQKGNESTAGSPLSSRVEYMVSAMMDLKNNKKRKKDAAYADKVSKLRKFLGQVKSKAATSAFRSSESSSLRIGLDDILSVSTNGRWWKVGASWVGNQHRFAEDADGESQKEKNKKGKEEEAEDSKEDAKLLKLAAKARMNTDAKRAIFCIIMKSADCEDAFEKLSRAGHMKNRAERETVRVLMECCGNEKSYNPFYAHLASRLCEVQPQCKFSMQLAFWDIFKQFDDSVSIRKAANLAKLLFHMVIVNPALKLNILKALDLSSPDELTEPAMIFLTIFFTNVLEYFDDPSDLKRFLESEVKKHKSRVYSSDDEFDAEEAMDESDDGGLGPSISIFLLQTLKASPKYKEKGSKFRKNLKAAVKACDTEDFFF